MHLTIQAPKPCGVALFIYFFKQPKGGILLIFENTLQRLKGPRQWCSPVALTTENMLHFGSFLNKSITNYTSPSYRFAPLITEAHWDS